MKKIILIQAFVILTFTLKSQVTFRTSVPPGPILIGESFQVQYIVEDGATISNFKPGAFKNFRIVAGPNIYAGTNESKAEIKQVKNIVYTLVSARSGHFIIEGASAIINGNPEKSFDAPIEIISKETAEKRFRKEMPNENSGYFLKPGEDALKKVRENLFVRLTVNKKNCFVGEPVLATYKLYSRLESRSEIVKNPGFYGFTVYDMINLTDKQIATEMIRGKLFDVHTIRQVQLFPLQSGHFMLDAMEIRNRVEFSHSAVYKNTEPEVVEGLIGNDTNEMTADNTEVVETNLSTEPIDITVKPVPVKSKPSNFNGATGNFTISVNLEKNKLAENEEGRLDIIITGKGNFTQLSPPTFEWPAGIEGFEPLVKDRLDKTQMPLSGSRTFHYSFIAAKPGMYSFPEVRFSFYDTDSRKYITVYSPVPAVSVSKEEKIIKAGNLPEVKKYRTGLKYWVTGITALLLFFTGWFLYFKQRKTTAVTPGDQSLMAKPDLSIDEILAPALLFQTSGENIFYSALKQAIWEFFNEHFHFSGSEMNKNNLLAKLEERNVPEQLIQDTILILKECETGMYTQATLSNTKEDLFQKTRNKLIELNRLLHPASGSN